MSPLLSAGTHWNVSASLGFNTNSACISVTNLQCLTQTRLFLQLHTAVTERGKQEGAREAAHNSASPKRRSFAHFINSSRLRETTRVFLGLQPCVNAEAKTSIRLFSKLKRTVINLQRNVAGVVAKVEKLFTTTFIKVKGLGSFRKTPDSVLTTCIFFIIILRLLMRLCGHYYINKAHILHN